MPTALTDAIRLRARRWALRRQGRDGRDVQLHRRRVYILPTRLGMTYGLAVFAMLLAAMNYSNSMTFLMAFGLAGVGLVSMHHCHRNLVGLRVIRGAVEPVFAGQDARFHIICHNPARSPRRGLHVSSSRADSRVLDLRPGESGQLPLTLATERRGRFRPGPFQLATEYPFGLFRAWVWVDQGLECLVYPRPAPAGRIPPPAPDPRGREQSRETSGQQDFAGFRAYHPGDSPRHIAWKATARSDELLVKRFGGGGVSTVWLDWDAVPETDPEARLSQLCRWVLDADAAGHAWGLRLPGRRLTPDAGPVHRNRCLQALALFGKGDGSDE